MGCARQKSNQYCGPQTNEYGSFINPFKPKPSQNGTQWLGTAKKQPRTETSEYESPTKRTYPIQLEGTDETSHKISQDPDSSTHSEQKINFYEKQP